MGQNPSSVADSHSAGHEIYPPRLWNPKVHYCFHESPPPYDILSQMSPVHIPTPYSLKVHAPASYPMGSGGRAAGSWSWPLTTF